MYSHTAKQEALDLIMHLPDTVNFDEILYQLLLVKKIHQGLAEAEKGEGLTTMEMLREIEQW